MSSAIQEVESLLPGASWGRVGGGGRHADTRASSFALVARGHVLVQGVPGPRQDRCWRKTLARTLGGRIQAYPKAHRISCRATSSVYTCFDEAQRSFVFRPWDRCSPDVVLVDEIKPRRAETPSRRCSRAMEERQVSGRAGGVLTARPTFWCSQPRIHASLREPIHCRSRNSTGSCCESMWITPTGSLKPRSWRAMGGMLTAVQTTLENVGVLDPSLLKTCA